MRRESPQDQQGPGHRSRPAGEGSGLSQWVKKDRTKKGKTTGFDWDVATLRAVKGERMDGGRGGVNGHSAQVFRGCEGNLVTGQGRQGSKCR